MDSKSRLTVEELQLFSNQLDNIPIKVSGKDCVTQLLEQVVKFKETAQKLLCNNKLEDLEELKKVIETGKIISRKISEIETFKYEITLCNMHKVRNLLETMVIKLYI